MKSEIGQCVYVLFYGLAGKTLAGGQLKSRNWWNNRLQTLINDQAIEIKTLYNTDMADVPLIYEKEMGFEC